MAQSSASLVYDRVGIRESLMDVVTNISPSDTPLLSSLAKSSVGQPVHSWQTDSLTTYTETNAAVEGADFAFTKAGARTLVTNYTQILNKTWEVSYSVEASDIAGAASEYAYEMKKAMTELSTDIEASLMNGTGNSGASGTGRRMKGVVAFIETNVETGSGTGTQDLTESLYNDALETIWAAGGRPDTTFVGSFQKRQISAFSTPSTRNIDAGDGKIRASVDIYQSDFGLQTIKLHRDVPTDKAILMQMDKFKVGTLREVKEYPVAQLGSAKRGAAEGELTLISLNEAASGKITELATS